MIWRILKAYKETFTLRHAHYGEFYAAYSAVLVILQQAPQNHDQYIECIEFFWSMLSEPQRSSLGFALGLKKPFRLLKLLMRRNKFVTQQINVGELATLADGPPPSSETCDTFLRGKLPTLTSLVASLTWTDAMIGWETGMPDAADAWAHSQYETMTDELFFADSCMFGLFTQ